MLLFCMVYTSYYLAHVLYRNSWVFSVQFNYNLLCSCCIMMSGLVMISYVGDMLCMSYLPNLLYSNKGCWSGFYGTSHCVCLSPWVAVSPRIVYDMIRSWCVHDMFVHIEWYCPDWIFHHMFVTCCACIIWQIYSEYFSNQRMLEWFLWHYRDRHYYSFGDMCSQPSHLCHSSCYVHVALSCLVILLCVCDMLYMYHLLAVQYLGLSLFFQPAVVGMFIIAFYWFGAGVVNHPFSAWWITGFGKFVHVYADVSPAFPCNVITNN